MKPDNRKSFLILRATYPDVILLMRCADIYRSWDDDAELICKLIDSIKLLQKNRFTVCDIEVKQIDEVLNKLIKAQYKVAICDPL